jgi:hypothetical protein
MGWVISGTMPDKWQGEPMMSWFERAKRDAMMTAEQVKREQDRWQNEPKWRPVPPLHVTPQALVSELQRLRAVETAYAHRLHTSKQHADYNHRVDCLAALMRLVETIYRYELDDCDAR